MSFVDGLNDKQAEATIHKNSPLVIIAGAGSGKTRVLTHRIAWLLEEGLRPWQILAITFTNKAAGELKSRVGNLAGESALKDMWVSTFHSSCVRLLKRHASLVGYRPDFSIYDSSDSLKVVRAVLKDMELDPKEVNANNVKALISEAKNNGDNADLYEDKAAELYPGNPDEMVEMFKRYDKKLFESNAMDFDDLLLNTVLLFERNPDVLEKYRDQFKHILVDEYQDTNSVQNRMIVLLAENKTGVTVVGDQDQSIYKFRGADFRNLLDFKQAFPTATIVKLEQNYRSTPTILDAANRVISNNIEREEKTLWTSNEPGAAVRYTEHDSERREAEFVADEIVDLVKSGMSYESVAVFYRMNAMSRILEERFTEDRIPYKVIGGMRFYDRQEVKDMLAWLKIVVNSDDEVAIRRAIAAPRRGVGAGSLKKVADASVGGQGSFWRSLRSTKIGGKAGKGIKEFVQIVDDLLEGGESAPSNVLAQIMDDSGYLESLRKEGTVEAMSRIDNLHELITAAAEFDSVSEYLHHVSLLADADNIKENEDTVKLMTLHTSKGLEFPAVFIVGLEETIFPGFRSLESEEAIAEERRLMYVGMTRAETRLYVNWCSSRWMFGEIRKNPRSRFINESKTHETLPSSKQTFVLEPKEDHKAEQDDLINHKTWGKGKVLKLEGEGDSTEIIILFDDPIVGEKTLLMRWAPIYKIS